MKPKYLFLLLIAAAAGFAAAWLFKPATPEGGQVTPAPEAEAGIWTCSMHPQIRQDGPGLCPICGMDLIPLESSAAEGFTLEMTPEAVKLAQVQTTVIGTGQAHTVTGLSLNGKLQTDERAMASLTAHLPGRIEKLYIGFTGEYVRRGEPIASIYSPELITAQRELLEAHRIRDLNPALVEAARNKLRFWKLPEADIDRILEDGAVRETFDIYADASGVITARRVQVGDHVKEGGVLFDVQRLDRLWVVFEAYESDLPHIRMGDRVEFTTAALPGKTYSTRIDFIDPVIDRSSRIARVRGSIDNTSGKLKPEMFVSGRLAHTSGGGTAEALTVPRSAVLWTGSRSVVYVKVPDLEVPTFEYREVLLGEPSAGGYLVLEGLEAGEEVVTNGAFAIDASAQLNNRSSMINRMVSVGGGEPVDAGAAETGPEYTSEYVCPMHCEGSGSDEPGRCPVCNMEYVPNPDFAPPSERNEPVHRH